MVNPPLNEHEVSYLQDFNRSRRMDRRRGPWYAAPGENFGQEDPGDVLNYNQPHESQPGLWCQWTVSDDGREIYWDGGEKFYNAELWMGYIIDAFLKPGAMIEKYVKNEAPLPLGWELDERFQHFTFDHTMNGAFDAQGEDYDDRWAILVVSNNVLVSTEGSATPIPGHQLPEQLFANPDLVEYNNTHEDLPDLEA